MKWLTWLFRPLKHRRLRQLAERYAKIARTYEDMAELTKNMCPQPKPLPWDKYCKIQQVTYELRAEELEELL